MASTAITWPSETDLSFAEHPDYVRLCRVLVGLRGLSNGDRSVVAFGADMNRDTQKLVDELEATQLRISLLVVQLRDGTATPDEHHKLANEIGELPDLLRSHGDDIDAGIIPAGHDMERECA